MLVINPCAPSCINIASPSCLPAITRTAAKKVNILGNNVTDETVIRNQLEIDEGDPFNQILYSKSVNNIKSLNFFRDVKGEVINDDVNDEKTINITIEEKPTGEIFAGAGTGTSGTTISFGVRENNYLGKGVLLDTNANITSDSIKGRFLVENPNYKNYIHGCLLFLLEGAYSSE